MIPHHVLMKEKGREYNYPLLSMIFYDDILGFHKLSIQSLQQAVPPT